MNKQLLDQYSTYFGNILEFNYILPILFMHILNIQYLIKYKKFTKKDITNVHSNITNILI